MENELLEKLNASTAIERLDALKSLVKLVENGTINLNKPEGYVNNHIHTTYSFSPYSPTLAIWEAKMAGLMTAGIVDHDSIGGADEFIKAGQILKMATTIGLECRVNMQGTKFENRRINNGDQIGIAYVTIHGIPNQKIKEVEEFIKPYREHRFIRNLKMVDKINDLFGDGFLDYKKDVEFFSQCAHGGSVTERHIMFALAKKLIQIHGKGSDLVNVLSKDWNLEIKDQVKKHLLDIDNSVYEYDLLNLLKGTFIEKIYVKATKELPNIKDLVVFAKEIGAIPAYAYLGDVDNSITGDKKNMKFEDDYLDEIITYMKKVGFEAITYMPSRNSDNQLNRLRELCRIHGFFQISGEDINSPRQLFTCEALLKPENSLLVTSTWAMIGHEKEATKQLDNGMFSKKTIEKLPLLEDRINYFVSKAK